MRNIEIFKWKPSNILNAVVAIIVWHTDAKGNEVDNIYLELETIGM
jgi:hypothetical protein